MILKSQQNRIELVTRPESEVVVDLGVTHQLSGVVVDVAGTPLAVELVNGDTWMPMSLLVLGRVLAVGGLDVVPHLC